MKKLIPLIITLAMSMASAAYATQADDTTVNVVGQSPGASPFISKVRLLVSQPDALRSIQFTIAPKDGSVTRPVSATYLPSYLDRRGFFNSATGVFTLPVWGLYAGRANDVTVRFLYNDLSSEELPVVIVAAPFSDDCDFENPVVNQARTNTTDLSFDFILVASSCSTTTPHILDTDGEIRWVGTAGVQILLVTAFYDNAVYIGDGPRLLRIEMDGEVNIIADYTSAGVVGLHHNIDIGRDGLLLEMDTIDQVEAVIFEVHPITGAIQKRYNFAQIVGDAIRAGGEDPGDPNDLSSFIRKANGDYSFMAKEDWFHNNASTYRSSDNTLIVSARELFVIAIDYDTKEIKWLLGDKTKRWYVEFDSLKAFALDANPATVPIGQHALSITADNNLLLFDNGQTSVNHTPAGVQRGFANARKYSLDLQTDVATQLAAYPGDASVFTPFCSSVYEDAPLNYMLDYAVRGGIPGGNGVIMALTSTGEKVFEYSYPTGACDDAYRSLPIHLEETAFPTSNVHLANISSRAFVGADDNASIAGFIITGSAPKPLVIRGLGPSLPVDGHLMDPTLELYNSAGQLIRTNDNYNDSPGLAVIQREGLAPSDASEAAMAPVLTPGAYTVILRGAGNTTGVGLIEVYDIDLRNSSKLANLSTRALVGTGDQVLIGGVILRG
ncbi:MAG TPA: aryl-sulfate sulfotransferase, partial [Chthoniobacterales bacterium]|nr:aryl-sulfate sulfotransferase [Chthoniobacterales bacterium]